jgi:hypothetical protein
MASGLRLPSAGSFQDAILQEMLFRDQNLRYAEVSLMVRLFEHVMFYLQELTTDAKNLPKRQTMLSERISGWLQAYEAELYQDRYAPAYQQRDREAKRRAVQEALDQQAREQRALEKVRAFGK